MFNLQLSVSTTVPKDRRAAEMTTQFEVKDIPVLDPVLTDLFTTRLYSTNQWKGGKCKNSNFEKMSGITVDVDQGVTIVEAKEIFKEFNYIIHTSTSHRADIQTKGGIQDRFRVILPFAPADYALVNNEALAKATYAGIIKKYPFVDAACADPGRKYFPFLTKPSLALFELHINDVGKYYPLDIVSVNKMVKAPVTATAKNAAANEAEEFKLSLEDEVILPDRTTKVKIKDITKKTPCYCIFCDDINSKSPSAFVEINSWDNRYFLFCSHCNKTYWLSLAESFPDVFFLDHLPMRIVRYGSNVSVGRMAPAYLNHLSKQVRDKFEHDLTLTRNFTADAFTVEKMVDPDGTEVRYKLDAKSGRLSVWVPPIGVDKQDNKFIDDWLQSMFNEYTGFVKKWMAIWCHSNFRKLPMLVLNGPRAAGKTTFGEFLQNIYPTLCMEWKGEEQHFTDYLECKLLLIEEVSAEKKEQYTYLKRRTGTDQLLINKKYKAPYKVENNLSLIMMTNSYAPLYLNANEIPVNEATNQFFMYTLTRDTRTINANLSKELKERAGHYMRTELRRIFNEWQASGEGNSNRYSIATPITPVARIQFSNARSIMDYQADMVLKVCLHGLNLKAKDGTLINRIGPYETISVLDFQTILRAVNIEWRYMRGLRDAMQALNYISADAQIIKKDGIDAWKVIGKLPEDPESGNAPMEKVI